MSGRPRIALCPGTYDPITLGHLDIIERAARIFDGVVVGVVERPQRKRPMFDDDERIGLCRKSVAHLDNVRVEGFNSLVVAFARDIEASVIVKGLRAISDFDYEFQMAQFNRHMAEEVETLYLPASPRYSFISSSGVREVAAWGGEVDHWVPEQVAAALRERRVARAGSAD